MPGAFVSGLATFRPLCRVYYTAYCLWDRFGDIPWQLIVRRGLASLTIGLVLAGGSVFARVADTEWQGRLVTAAAVGLLLATRSVRRGFFRGRALSALGLL
jgi:chromate transport protein ChrA